jgi:hypothetical protein
MRRTHSILCSVRLAVFPLPSQSTQQSLVGVVLLPLLASRLCAQSVGW